MAQKDYIETINPQKYVNNREITNLPGIFLVQGSRDCLIVNKEKVASRKGYSLVGAAATVSRAVVSSFDWETNRNVTRSLRMNTAGTLEAYYDGAWYTLKSHSAGSRANFAPWWDSTEKIDNLLYVDGKTDNVHMWTGGMAEIAAATATTVSLKGYISASTIAFVDGGASNDTITDTGNGFVTAGFAAGDTIEVSGTVSNDGTYTILTVAAGTLTLYPDDELTNESAGSAFTIKKPNATWAEQGFLTAGTRSVRINDTEYTYTGGESTGTLTGLSGVSGVSADDIAMQAVVTSTPATLDGLTLDLIGVFNNYVFYGDLTSRVIPVSTDSDYTAFTEATPRVQGNGTQFTLDDTPTAFVPGGSGGQEEDEFYISGRKDSWYKITFRVADDLTSEEVRVKKLPTSTGQAAQTQGSVVNIKNSTAFLTFEPTIDTLGRLTAVDTAQSQALSYDIKNDLLTYDLTDANGLFYQNQIFMAIPNESILLVYDIEQNLWQPPQHLPIGRLALIDIDGDGTQYLCGHSNTKTETYKLYDGYNDNGAPINVEMHFGYANYGSRFMQKTLDELATELYMSENTVVTNKIVYDYKGATAVKDFEIRGDDDATRFTPQDAGGLGFAPLGSEPLGSLATGIDDLSKYRVVDMTSATNFFERQRVFQASGIDIRFAVIAFGENARMSGDIPNFIKR